MNRDTKIAIEKSKDDNYFNKKKKDYDEITSEDENNKVYFPEFAKKQGDDLTINNIDNDKKEVVLCISKLDNFDPQDQNTIFGSTTTRNLTYSDSESNKNEIETDKKIRTKKKAIFLTIGIMIFLTLIVILILRWLVL